MPGGDKEPERGLLPSGEDRLDEQLAFSVEIDKMTGVLRQTLLIDKSRRENDAEHSWHIAVMAMLFAEYAAEPVNVDHAVRMCLVHDLVEIIAGDTFAYDREGNRDKAKRESAAADELFAMLPAEQGGMLRTLWEEFDSCVSADARYANCMDRLQPFIHNTMTGGHTWGLHGTTRTQVEERMALIREFMPGIYSWIRKNLDRAQEQGWLRD